MRSKGINPTEHVQVIYFPLTPTVCQRAHLCLKLEDVSVSDDRPQARKVLSDCGEWRTSATDTWMTYRWYTVNHTLIKEIKERVWLVMSSSSVFYPLLLKVIRAGLTDVCGYRSTKMTEVCWDSNRKARRYRRENPVCAGPWHALLWEERGVHVFTQCGCIVLPQLIINRSQSSHFIAFPVLLIKKKSIGSLLPGLTGVHWLLPWT